MTPLKDLLSRLREAEGADRELDALLAALIAKQGEA